MPILFCLYPSCLFGVLLFVFSTAIYASEVVSYGNFKRMVHSKNSNGVIDLKAVLLRENMVALGAIQHGLGEITVIDGRSYLDYGNDGLGNATSVIPDGEKAVILVASQVASWQKVQLKGKLEQQKLFKVILQKAKRRGIDINSPFPFLIEGQFEELKLHVINGRNLQFKGHHHGASGEMFYKMIAETQIKQSASVLGFYSANDQGTYTHPGESWHLHAYLKKGNVSAHVDNITTSANVTLSLPAAVP